MSTRASRWSRRLTLEPEAQPVRPESQESLAVLRPSRQLAAPAEWCPREAQRVPATSPGAVRSRVVPQPSQRPEAPGASAVRLGCQQQQARAAARPELPELRLPLPGLPQDLFQPREAQERLALPPPDRPAASPPLARAESGQPQAAPPTEARPVLLVPSERTLERLAPLD